MGKTPVFSEEDRVEEQRLETEVRRIMDSLRVGRVERRSLQAFLAPLKQKCAATRFHYRHCLRVGILLERIAKVSGFDTHRKALFYAGILHDIGKAQIPLSTLNKLGQEWTERDAEIMKRHVMNGYLLLQGRFDFIAEIILLHHRFQPNSYPKHLPNPLHNFSAETKQLIQALGRLLALADSYDAMHRNDRVLSKIEPTGEQIKRKMLEFNPDRRELVNKLYAAGVFKV